MANIGDGRPVRYCPLCQQADDHPKHLLWGEDDNIGRHMDCCKAAGCPDGTCEVLLAGDPTPGTGQAMLDHIEAVHDTRDVAAEVETLQESRPELREWTVPGLEPVQLQGADQ